MSDPVVHGLEHVAGRLTKAAGRDAGKAVETVLHDAGHGVESVSENVAKTEAEHVAHFDGIAKIRQDLHRDIGSTPVYKLSDEGVVQRLTPHGPAALTQADRDRLKLKLDGNDRVPSRKVEEGQKNPYNLPRVKKGTTRPRVESTEVPFGEGDLAKATQLARHEDQSYGNYKKIPDSENYKFESNNYAAVRYGEKGDPNGFILVGRSEYPTHSERVLGIPFLQSGSEHGITALYTERAPCSSSPNCGGWMHHFLPGHISVTHSTEYGPGAASQLQGNNNMKDYLNGLNPNPSKHAAAGL
ncbi:hypothetical protein ABIA33_001035 [Streptacidiphilus sp. MAP12-16]|uniref:nucleic acid/nucleotide deaminase domain-containing protein n=1 Tax=Streptacidiphilus sp. MAP12-16 TaxID=3156300 RepID=UPI003518E358